MKEKYKGLYLSFQLGGINRIKHTQTLTPIRKDNK